MNKLFITLNVAIFYLFFGCSKEKEELAPQIPIACIETPTEPVISGIPIQLLSCSENSVHFNWTVKSGTHEIMASTEENPTFTFPFPDTYTIILKTSTADKSREYSTTLELAVDENIGYFVGEVSCIDDFSAITANYFNNQLFITASNTEDNQSWNLKTFNIESQNVINTKEYNFKTYGSDPIIFDSGLKFISSTWLNDATSSSNFSIYSLNNENNHVLIEDAGNLTYSTVINNTGYHVGNIGPNLLIISHTDQGQLNFKKEISIENEKVIGHHISKSYYGFYVLVRSENIINHSVTIRQLSFDTNFNLTSNKYLQTLEYQDKIKDVYTDHQLTYHILMQDPNSYQAYMTIKVAGASGWSNFGTNHITILNDKAYAFRGYGFQRLECYTAMDRTLLWDQDFSSKFRTFAVTADHAKGEIIIVAGVEQNCSNETVLRLYVIRMSMEGEFIRL